MNLAAFLEYRKPLRLREHHHKAAQSYSTAQALTVQSQPTTTATA